MDSYRAAVTQPAVTDQQEARDWWFPVQVVLLVLVAPPLLLLGAVLAAWMHSGEDKCGEHLG